MNEPLVNEALALETQIPVAHHFFSHRVVIFLISAFATSLCVTFAYLYLTIVPSVALTLEVSESDTIETIAHKLSDERLIRHPFIFYIGHKIYSANEPIEAGGYALSSKMQMSEIVRALESSPLVKFVQIPANKTKSEIGEIVGEALDWGLADKQYFANTLAGMQWQHYQEAVEHYFQEEYSWSDSLVETFMTLSSLYYDDQYDFFKDMYVAGDYEFPLDISRAQAAGMILDKFLAKHPDDHTALHEYINENIADNVATLITTQTFLLPDLVALPPEDVKIVRKEDQVSLLFSALYWNKGQGPLELIGDPKTRGTTGKDRQVLQRIYKLDGDYTDVTAGKIAWHGSHSHYHFDDFALYSLEPVDRDGAPLLSSKATYCIRDSEPIDIESKAASKSALYTACGKEKQGISAGWADAYYFNYVDQSFDVTNLRAGQYRLKVTIDPEDRFDEISKTNNSGEIIVYIDPVTNEVRIISESTNANQI